MKKTYIFEIKNRKTNEYIVSTGKTMREACQKAN